jgi:KaiC/GvpD/RAD55 family RecA-like ATPase
MAAKNSAPREPKLVTLGVPGLDEVIGKGLRDQGLQAGRLIVIIGPPGSGKTLLALQLLQEMRWRDNSPDIRPGLFVSCDESKEVLEEQIRTMLPDPMEPVPRPVVMKMKSQLTDHMEKAAASASRRADPNDTPTEYLRGDPLVQGLALHKALTQLRENIRTTWEATERAESGGYGAICVDGLLNFPEIRCANEDGRRQALFTIASCLRYLVNSSPPRKAAILTMEAEPGDPPHPQVEDYLADVVIRFGIGARFMGKRRRYLEVTKCRYTSSVLGEHSLWIMDEREIRDRRAEYETLGWLADASKNFRRGVVVFPRVRWEGRARSGQFGPAKLEEAAMQARNALAKITDLPSDFWREYGEDSLDPIVGKILRRKPLTAADLNVVESVSEMAKGARLLYKSNESVIAVTENIINLCAEIENQREIAGSYCSFGISGLDSMFGPERSGGIARDSSAVIMGEAGTGKSTLAYAFMQQGILNGEDVVFLSFDERLRRVLIQAGNLCIETGIARGTRTYSPPLVEMIARQFRLRTQLAAAVPRLRFVYVSPVNCDVNEWMTLLRREVGNSAEQRDTRLIVDSISDLERAIDNVQEFNHLVTTLLNCCADWRVTPLLLYEAPVGQDEADRPVSHLADNVVLLRQVQINNQTRKCVAIRKARGRRHEKGVAELTFHQLPDDRLYVEVRKGFEGMSRILSGRPEPINIALRLFHENKLERAWNRRIFNDLVERFGQSRVRLLPFNINNARMTYWDRQKARDIQPDADVTVVALDEPWVQVFAHVLPTEGPAFSEWDPEVADDAQLNTVGQMHPNLRDLATHDASTSGALRPLLALPHYFDLGLFTYRPDLLESETVPTCWTGGNDAAQQATSFLTIAGRLHERLLKKNCKNPIFAFNADSAETTACVFMEMCWNFFAREEFLFNPDANDRKAAIEALQFLAQLHWQGLLPMPCTLRDCSQSVFARCWYANLPSLRTPQQPHGLITLPFLTACRPEPLVIKRLLQEVADAKQSCRAQLAAISQYGGQTPYSEYVANCESREVLDNLLEFLEQRRLEINTHDRPFPGWSCSGAWYLGVISSGGNANLGWSIVHEAISPQRAHERTLAGVGLPVYPSYYVDHANERVPHLRLNFRDMRSLLNRTRSRTTSLRLASSGSFCDQELLQVCGLLPDLLQSLVMRVLRNSGSHPIDPKAARAFIEGEVDRLFADIKSRLVTVQT